ncbi:MAG: phage portal protein [Pseudomonas sp.]
MPIGQPGSEGLKLVPYNALRQFAEVSSVTRACIEVRKNEILGLEWDIAPTDHALSINPKHAEKKDFQQRREEVVAFFHRPDLNYKNYQAWMGALLEDLFVTDSMALWVCPTKGKGKGVVGSDVAELWSIDGTTIRPLVDVSGSTPRPPAPAYQQYLWGIPRSETMDIIVDRDLDEMEEEYGTSAAHGEFKADQLLFLPHLTRNWTPYGFSHVERCILPTTTSIKRQQWQLDFFMEGSIPGTFITPGPEIGGKTQQRELQETLNAIAGDAGYKHKIVVLPPGSRSDLQKPIDLAGHIDETLYQQIMMAFNVMPQELGIMMGRGGAGGSGMQGGAQSAGHAQAQMQERKSLRPMLVWLAESLFSYVLREMLGQDDMQWKWPMLDLETDQETKANVWKILTSFGAMTIDEVRDEMGKQPYGLPQTSDPMVFTGTGATPLGNIPPALEAQEWDNAPLIAGPTGPQMDPTTITQQAVAHTQAMQQAAPQAPAVEEGKDGKKKKKGK